MGHAADGLELLESGVLLVLLRVDRLDAAEYRSDLFTAGGRASVHLSTVLAGFLARNAGRISCSFLGFFSRIISAGRLERRYVYGFKAVVSLHGTAAFLGCTKLLKSMVRSGGLW